MVSKFITKKPSQTHRLMILLSFSGVAVLGRKNCGISSSNGDRISQTLEGVAAFLPPFTQAVLKLFPPTSKQSFERPPRFVPTRFGVVQIGSHPVSTEAIYAWVLDARFIEANVSNDNPGVGVNRAHRGGAAGVSRRILREGMGRGEDDIEMGGYMV